MKNSSVEYQNRGKNKGVLFMIFISLITIMIAAFIIYKFHYDTNATIVVVIVTLVIIGFSWYFSSTEEGKRTIKDFTSNVSGGIPRQVKVYDFNGKLIEEYEGTFDIETNHDNYLLFDDESGLRHLPQEPLLLMSWSSNICC